MIAANEKTEMRKVHIYALGVIPLGFFHTQLKSAFPHPASMLLSVVMYCLILRLIAEKFGKP
jgi:hypothetical protein